MRGKLLQLCITLFESVHCSLPGFSVHGILQARILQRAAVPPVGDLPDPGIEPLSHGSCTGGFLTSSTTWEAHFELITPLKAPSPHTVTLWVKV